MAGVAGTAATAGATGTAGASGTGGATGTGGASGTGGATGTAGTSGSASEAAERARIAAALTAVASLDTAGLAARYPTAFASTLSYDPRTAANLSLIRDSRLGLTTAEETALVRNGFVISDRQKFPTFIYGYASIYGADLPLFVSADSILYVVHRSYDSILKQVELSSLRPALKTLLAGMRSALAAGTVSALGTQTAADLDLYLAVASGLLDPGSETPVAGASADQIASLLTAAKAAQGLQGITLFGLPRMEDFSQFVPRGHYTDSEDLKSYFKAMMWLGRIDLRIIETQQDGSQKFQRRAFDGALGLASLVTPELRSAFDKIDRTIQVFVGESDNMRVDEFAPLLARLGAAGPGDVVGMDDASIQTAIVAGDFGSQRISSHVMINGLGKGTLPLSRTFLLMGQRYVIDSHVFSNVVYDRVQGGAVSRMMPDPLDVAFAALGNNQAATLLKPQLDMYRYASDLASMRVLVDDHGDSFWDSSLYNQWLGAVRSLARNAATQTSPLEIAQTEAWGRRTLNSQLASWAELRHDTILYAKQSYTSGGQCAFPDALVEPNPAFFTKLRAYASKGGEMVNALGIGTSSTDFLGKSIVQHFTRLGDAAAMLESMATYQAQGTPFTTEQMAFINQTVALTSACGQTFASGWYPNLFFQTDPTKFSPTIADVHTQPTDAAGNPVGRVLHVGTGNARLIVLTANTCTGPRAYAGLVSSYFEETTSNFTRLDDPTWAQRFSGTSPADVGWMSDLIAR